MVHAIGSTPMMLAAARGDETCLVALMNAGGHVQGEPAAGSVYAFTYYYDVVSCVYALTQ